VKASNFLSFQRNKQKGVFYGFYGTVAGTRKFTSHLTRINAPAIHLEAKYKSGDLRLNDTIANHGDLDLKIHDAENISPESCRRKTVLTTKIVMDDAGFAAVNLLITNPCACVG